MRIGVKNKVYPELSSIDPALKEKAITSRGWGSRFYIIKGTKGYYAASFNCFQRLANALLKIFGFNYFAHVLGEKSIHVLSRDELKAADKKADKLFKPVVQPPAALAGSKPSTPQPAASPTTPTPHTAPPAPPASSPAPTLSDADLERIIHLGLEKEKQPTLPDCERMRSALDHIPLEKVGDEDMKTINPFHTPDLFRNRLEHNVEAYLRYLVLKGEIAAYCHAPANSTWGGFLVFPKNPNPILPADLTNNTVFSKAKLLEIDKKFQQTKFKVSDEERIKLSPYQQNFLDDTLNQIHLHRYIEACSCTPCKGEISLSIPLNPERKSVMDLLVQEGVIASWCFAKSDLNIAFN
jgi:hypothetical protein